MTDATSTKQAAVEALEGLLCRFNTDRLAYKAAERGLSVIKNLSALVTETWNRAHSPAPCGHARANWKDPKYGTPEYQGDEKCEVCDLVAEKEQELALLRSEAEAFSEGVLAWQKHQPIDSNPYPSDLVLAADGLEYPEHGEWDTGWTWMDNAKRAEQAEAASARDAELALSNSQRLMRERREAEAAVAQMRKAAGELINEIDKHPIRTLISDTSINWFKRLLRETLPESTDEDGS